MEINVQMQILSLLSDAQHIIEVNPETANQWINEAKKLVIKYMSDHKFISEEELEKVCQ